ncbi:hypothetical protein ACHAXT_008337 [Thalassiosira profunda]
MKVSCLLLVCIAALFQSGVVLAETPDEVASSGKPGQASRDLGGWGWSSTTTSKSSKSTAEPTFFPTTYPTLSPTYCWSGKTSKSSWSSWHSGRKRKLGDWGWWSSSSTSSKSCWKPSKDWSSSSSHSRRSRDSGKIRRSSHHNYKKRRHGSRDLGQEDTEGAQATEELELEVEDGTKKIRRRQINIEVQN